MDQSSIQAAGVNLSQLFVDLHSMDTTAIFMNTTEEYRNATDHFMDYTELFTQKALFPLASQFIFSHTVSCRPLS